MMNKNKNAQIWGLDIIVAFIIFLTGIIAFYLYSLNYPTQAEETLEKLYYDAEIISDSILSTGYPESWTQENVVKIGILTDNKINQEKLENFYNLSQANYSLTKSLFNTKYDYFLNFSVEMYIDSQPIQGIGKPGTSLENMDVLSLIKTKRYTVYNNKPIRMYLYVWEE